MFHEGTRKIVNDVHKEKCIVFKPQLISYCIPDHDELYDAAKNCKVCVVIHARYPVANADSVQDLSVNFGFDASQHSNKDILILSPFTSELGSSMMITKAEKSKLISWKRTAARTLPQCSKFLNEISESYEDSWSITYLIKQYFNTRVREGQKLIVQKIL